MANSGRFWASISSAAILSFLPAAGDLTVYTPPTRDLGAHRYWQVRFHTNLGGSFTVVTEVEMRETVGGADVTGSGTASGSSGTPANAFDNSTATEFAISGGVGFLAYDFGAGQEKDIREITIRNPTSSGFNNTPGRFDIEWSDDGTNWTVASRVITSVTEWNGAFGTTLRFIIPAVSYRVNIRATSAGGNPVLSQFQLRSTVGGSDETSGEPQAPIGYSSGSSDPSVNVFDGSDSTVWTSTVAIGYVRFDFPTAVPLSQVMLSILTENTTRPSVFTIEASVDGGVNWVVVMAPPTQSSWLTAEDRTFDVENHAPTIDTAQLHRYWRVLIVWSNSVQSTAASEFQMREVPGGPDAGGTYSASGGTVANARDGSTSTFWRDQSSGAVASRWIKADFGSGNEKDINEIYWRSWQDASGYNEVPHIAVVQWSDDDSAWSDKWYMEFRRSNASLLEETHTYPNPFYYLPDEPDYDDPPPVVDDEENVYTPAIVYTTSKSSNQLSVGRTHRARIRKENLVSDGDTVRAVFSSGANPYTVHKAYIGLQATSGDLMDFESEPTQLLFGTEQEIVIPANSFVISDPVIFNVDKFDNLIVSHYGTGRARILPPQNGTIGRHKNGDFAATEAIGAMSDSDWRSSFAGFTALQTFGNAEYLIYRIEPLTSDRSSYSFAEIEMRATAGGADQCTGGTALASQSFSGTYDGPKAVDNSTATMWVTVNKTAVWWQYTFAAPVKVAEIAMTSRSDSPYFGETPRSFRLIASNDGTNWATLATVEGIGVWTATLQRVFTL